MAKLELRFGVRDGDRCASTWKVWTETAARQTEVYLVCRALNGELKASMHENGGWHVAHSKKYFENEAKGVIPWVTDRFTDRWTRPEMIAPGATFAFQIVTPWWSVTSPVKPADEKKVIPIPTAPQGSVTLISVFLTAPGVPPPPWSREVGTLPLRNGEAVLVVYWTADASNLSKPPEGRAAFYRGKGPEDVLKAGDLRMLGFGTAPNGARVIFDYAVLSQHLIQAPPSLQLRVATAPGTTSQPGPQQPSGPKG